MDGGVSVGGLEGAASPGSGLDDLMADLKAHGLATEDYNDDRNDDTFGDIATFGEPSGDNLPDFFTTGPDEGGGAYKRKLCT
ncbi:unnamed protein product [Heterosigma akashiwo]